MNDLTLALLIIFILWLISFVGSIVRGWYVGSWDGTDQSGRYNKGGLWLGGNKRTKKYFIIYNGRYSFQVQNWKPRIAFWTRPSN